MRKLSLMNKLIGTIGCENALSLSLSFSLMNKITRTGWEANSTSLEKKKPKLLQLDGYGIQYISVSYSILI